jgi:hypothetical protein
MRKTKMKTHDTVEDPVDEFPPGESEETLDSEESVAFYVPKAKKLPSQRPFVGRVTELAYCRAAWRVSPDKTSFLPGTGSSRPLHFRLQGPPGVGKNEIVYEIAQKLNKDLYIVQGHEEMTPEDLVLALAPDKNLSRQSAMPLVLRASPLVAAIRTGALVFFDEINRVPERALSVLSSVLDDRCQVYSAASGVWIGPRSDAARATFRFCCALNPSHSGASHVLPDYIQQRTLPVIKVDYPPIDDIFKIVSETLKCTEALLESFRRICLDREKRNLSVRQAISIMAFAMNYSSQEGVDETEAMKTAYTQTVG